jgi:hypothetical protein
MGQGNSCFDIECPEGTYCVSEDWWGQTDPKCKALLVDNENCGWLGHECASNRRCGNGLCRLKRQMPCDGECGEGEQCCWVLGVEVCVDLQNDSLHCGSCDTVCTLGDLCQEGTCQPWYDVWDPCGPFGMMNCGDDGVDCKDISNDHDNCGGCGLPCTDSGTCIDGECVGPDFGTDMESEP